VVKSLISLLLLSSVYAAIAPKYIQKIDDKKEVMSVNDNFREIADFANQTATDLTNFSGTGSTWSVHQVYDSLTTTTLIAADSTLTTVTITSMTYTRSTMTCRDGFLSLEVNGHSFWCIQTAENGSANWSTAQAACFALGARLPRADEWHLSVVNMVLTDEDDDDEWSGSVCFDSGSEQAVNVGTGSDDNSCANKSTSNAYRCLQPK